MIFYYIDNFRKSLKNLIKKDKGHCSSCASDIASDFNSKTYEEILISSTIIISESPIFLVKRRISNSCRHLSKRDGFRLYMIIDTNKESVTLCEIYSKRGKLSKVDLTTNERRYLLEYYADELENDTLSELDINNISAILI
ncbi:MAG: hypothetical protein A2X61_13340 [Ignavibacteria bacterium GWB2_35_12]|nr:MAG: hypothetical protein A2X63_12550 [Ignavibacteria bacterium GWA2_35_8]OGU41442.1 MAG: hypothetical protein A2X61_13340 [Ignavibacteria bacterium GWB2_35_12]OGU94994.1 MAG: hypothetical protein A2220_09500 [Ignavibacteria bacterium RIFOXYA2_FULL_35_10]OGV19381.1 MAG: hypothetical protein A2475_04750 [Ignavibacteria bacterium RIFOXYC2_FULL_35_21]